jgi:hypothetical protein
MLQIAGVSACVVYGPAFVRAVDQQNILMQILDLDLDLEHLNGGHYLALERNLESMA